MTTRAPLVIASGQPQQIQSTDTFEVPVSETVKISDATTASEPVALVLEHESSATPTTDYGVGMVMRGKSATVSSRDMHRRGATWIGATDATRRAKVRDY